MFAGQCYCEDCRRTSGAVRSAIVAVPEPAVQFTGEVKRFTKASDHESEITRAFCPNCGRPLTLEAVQPEMRQNATRAANSSLTYGLVGLAFNVVPLLVLVLPALLADPGASLLDRIRETLSPVSIALTAVLGVLPAFLAGFYAIRLGQRASWYLNLPAVLEQSGRGKAGVGGALGWLSIYLALGWILLTIIALL